MTGFSNNEFMANDIKFFITVKSVNSKFLDININLPISLQHMEDPLSKILKDDFSRGKFDAYIGVDRSTLPSKLNLNETLLEEYIKLAKKINKKLGSKDSVSFSNIINMEGIVNIKQIGKKRNFDINIKG